jgi:hypothetical protein
MAESLGRDINIYCILVLLGSKFNGKTAASPVGTHPVSIEVFLPEGAEPPFKVEITRAAGSTKASRPDRQDAPAVP